MEFILPIPTWLDVNPAGAEVFRGFRSEKGRTLLIDQNLFIERVLPGGVMRTLTDEEMNAYRAPFFDPASREPVYRFPNELPIAGAPAGTWAMAQAYQAWLLETEIPKLLFLVEPGSLIPPARAAWLQKRFKSCQSVPLGPGRHFVQEDHADRIGREIAAWLPTLR